MEPIIVTQAFIGVFRNKTYVSLYVFLLYYSNEINYFNKSAVSAVYINFKKDNKCI